MVGAFLWNAHAVEFLFFTLSLLAVHEFLNLFESKKSLGNYKFIIIGFHGLLGVALFFISFLDDQALLIWLGMMSYVGLFGLVLFLLPGDIEQRLIRSGAFLLSFIYPFFLFYSFNILVKMEAINDMNYNILYFFILIWSNDTFAYVCGRLLGKHKLAPSISPGKTIEGFFGGILCCIVASYLFGYIVFGDFRNPILHAVAPVVAGLFSTAGDLFESALKRYAGVKDSGTIMPGHGGVLDRFDGAMMAVWPFIITMLCLHGR